MFRNILEFSECFIILCELIILFSGCEELVSEWIFFCVDWSRHWWGLCTNYFDAWSRCKHLYTSSVFLNIWFWCWWGLEEICFEFYGHTICSKLSQEVLISLVMSPLGLWFTHSARFWQPRIQAPMADSLFFGNMLMNASLPWYDCLFLLACSVFCLILHFRIIGALF